MKCALFFIFTVLWLTSLPVSAKENPAQLFKTQMDETKKTVISLQPREVIRWIKDNKEFLMVDVRSKEEVLAGKIEAKNFMNIPRGILDIIASKGALNIDQQIVIYCKKGSRGLLAAKTLKDLGFMHVYNLKGGIHGWMESGLPITNSLGTFKAVPYKLTECAEN